MKPKYNLEKIKFATDVPTFERAVGLYESGKVTQFEEGQGGYRAVVLGTNPYRVFVFSRNFDQGDCNCYLGQKGVLCKHMVAVAIFACLKGREMSEDEKEVIEGPVCSGKKDELSKEELSRIKKEITSAMKYIKPYNGPSRTWFAYQDSLSEGCARLSKIVCDLPVSEQTAKLLVNLLLRLDKKLCTGGVDDSDGTVGGFIEETVLVLKECEKIDPGCKKAFEKLRGIETCFGWEEPLVE